MEPLTNAECWLLLVIAGVIILGLVVALICDHNEQIKDLFKACLPNGDKLREELYGKQLDEELEKVPTIGECVKILEKDAIAREVLERTGRDIIKEKENEKMNTEMPELKAGDLLKTVNGWVLAITPKTGYWLIYSENRGSFEIGGFAYIRGRGEIEAIYRDTIDSAFSSTTLRWIVSGTSGDFYILWKRENVKELTVDQISEALGYKVKVVGNA